MASNDKLISWEGEFMPPPIDALCKSSSLLDANLNRLPLDLNPTPPVNWWGKQGLAGCNGRVLKLCPLPPPFRSNIGH